MVYKQLDRAVTRLIAESHRGWSQRVLEDSICIMKIERALYGLIESAKLWYEELLVIHDFNLAIGSEALLAYIDIQRGISSN